jgi:hypothetical protein
MKKERKSNKKRSHRHRDEDESDAESDSRSRSTRRMESTADQPPSHNESRRSLSRSPERKERGYHRRPSNGVSEHRNDDRSERRERREYTPEWERRRSLDDDINSRLSSREPAVKYKGRGRMVSRYFECVDDLKLCLLIVSTILEIPRQRWHESLVDTR